jgi:hypothetical protein
LGVLGAGAGPEAVKAALGKKGRRIDGAHLAAPVDGGRPTTIAAQDSTYRESRICV